MHVCQEAGPGSIPRSRQISWVRKTNVRKLYAHQAYEYHLATIIILLIGLSTLLELMTCMIFNVSVVSEVAQALS